MPERPLQGMPRQWWLLSNWGLPWAVYPTRKQAIREAVEVFGKPWTQCRKFMEVRKVRVTPEPQDDCHAR